ncbi:MAG TPA: hypothetical protein VIN08_10955 [Ohtaekwangia sp.]|uniref:hypothetical protein n=1 Tax=Ohtaekwangia sp. TaxID=2066019 RepID=UPI002F922E8C
MYEQFLHNNRAVKAESVNDRQGYAGDDMDIKSFFEECGGYSFRNGLYKTHNPGASIFWASIIATYFSRYNGKIIPFAFDWLGRQYAISNDSRENRIIMFDPATMEDFALEQNLYSFHNSELVEDQESILSEQYFHEIMQALGINNLDYSACIGHKVPLFLNGTDTVDNFEVTNVEVYWSFQGQLYLQIKDLPPGTKIGSVKFEP